MSLIGIWGGLVILLAGLFFIIILLQKEKAIPAFVLGVTVIVFVPIWLDQLILHQWYLVIPIESSRTPEEWMDFLGSYLGVAGTIVAGALAYWQTRVNRNQDKELEKQKQEINRLQEQIAVYQIRPVIKFKKGTLKVYTGDRRQETNRNVYSQIYYSLRGVLPSDSLSSFAHIKISFREKGFVPVEDIYIERIEWFVDNQLYCIQLSKEKYSLMNGQLQVLIDCNDKIIKSGSDENRGQDFIDAMTIHQEYCMIGQNNFDKSQLSILVEFVNQEDKNRRYQLDYYLYSENNGEILFLTNPHVRVMGERDGDKNGTAKRCNERCN